MKKLLITTGLILIAGLAQADQNDQSIAIANLTAKISNLEEENRKLNGRIDELQHNLDLAKKDFTAAQVSAAAPAPAAVPAGSEVVKTTVDGSPVTKPNAYVTKVAPDPNIDAEFDEIFQSVVDEDYKTARPALKNFIEKHPGTSQSGEAYFWLGEIAWSERDFNTSAIDYLKGYKEAPTGEKAPENILKMALTLKELGKKDEACKYIKRFETEFPDAHSDLKGKAASAKSDLACK